MSVLTTTEAIKFYWQQQSVFDEVERETLYKGKTLTDKEGNPLIEIYALTEDETDIFKDYMKEAVRDAFNLAIKQSIGIANSLVIDGTIEGEANSYGFSVKNNSMVNTNFKDAADGAFNKFIKYSILLKWYSLNNLPDLIKHYQLQIMWTEQDLAVSLLYPFKKPNFS